QGDEQSCHNRTASRSSRTPRGSAPLVARHCYRLENPTAESNGLEEGRPGRQPQWSPLHQELPAANSHPRRFRPPVTHAVSGRKWFPIAELRFWRRRESGCRVFGLDSVPVGCALANANRNQSSECAVIPDRAHATPGSSWSRLLVEVVREEWRTGRR